MFDGNLYARQAGSEEWRKVDQVFGLDPLKLVDVLSRRLHQGGFDNIGEIRLIVKKVKE